MLGFPVVYAILLPSIAYVLIEGLPLGLLTQRITYALDSFPLVAVPLFIFVGNLMNLSGITDRIFRFAYTLVGRIPGGLAQVNVFGSLVFSGMSGAALADIGGLGRIEIDAMKKRGFDPSFAGAVTASSATLGPIFPPSIPLIVYGSVTSVSIVQLLVAGIMPALVCTAASDADRADRRHPPQASARRALADGRGSRARLAAGAAGDRRAGADDRRHDGRRLHADRSGGHDGGLCDRSSARVVYRELTLAHLWNSAVLTARSSSAILIIVAAAALFGWILAVEQVPQTFAAALLGLSKDPLVLLIIANLIFFIAGMFLDSHDRDAAAGADHRAAAGDGRRRPGSARHRHDLQPDDRPADAADGPVAVSGGRHRQGVDHGSCCSALLPFYIPLLATLAILTFCEGSHAVAAAHDRSIIIPLETS